MKSQTTVQRKSEREVIVSRTINAPPRLVFEAWTNPDLFKRWWVPKSFPVSLLSCEMDVRIGGKYRLVFDSAPQPMEFFGRYLEVTPFSRLVWTNDEGGEEAAAITTVTFAERDGKTLLTMRDRHPSKEALDASGATDAMPESLDQLEDFVVSLLH
ncbi:MAG: SRPBCC family protein [Chloroflexi bacterium]|nr:SRPBCC family protein [Chloroflexota bacterium]